MIYELACNEYLKRLANGLSQASQLGLLREIHHYEADLVRHSCAKATGDQNVQQLHEALVNLRRVQYYARCGDYAQC